MARWSFQQVEGVLYHLEGQPDARIATPRIRPTSVRHDPGPVGPFPESERRIDVTLAVRRLDADDRTVLERHYLRGARVPKAQRRTAVKRLVTLLGDLDTTA